MASALIGVAILNQTRQRPTARLLGLGAAGSLALALVGVSWEPLGRLGTIGLMAPALCLAALPAAHAWGWTGQQLWRMGKPGRALVAALMMAAAVGLTTVKDDVTYVVRRCVRTEPLLLGLNDERQEIVKLLLENTGPDARILWEDRPVVRNS